jgi:hypothetical protein
VAFVEGAGTEEDVPGWGGFREELTGELETDAIVGLRGMLVLFLLRVLDWIYAYLL